METIFLSTVKDAIRRRGENISSFEVESEVMNHPSVLEAAAVGVPSEFGEEDVLIAVVQNPDAAVTGENLLHHLSSRMPHFMIPRYVRFMDSLPKTPTAKVEKHKLRNEGVTPDTWDPRGRGSPDFPRAIEQLTAMETLERRASVPVLTYGFSVFDRRDEIASPLSASRARFRVAVASRGALLFRFPKSLDESIAIAP